MKTSFSTLMLAAAGLVVSTAIVDGQTRITADIPFAFRTTAGMQPAGQYALAPMSMNGNAIRLENLSTGQSVMFTSGAPDGDRELKPRLVFHCGDQAGCMLAGLWMGNGQGWTFPAPRKKTAEFE